MISQDLKTEVAEFFLQNDLVRFGQFRSRTGRTVPITLRTNFTSKHLYWLSEFIARALANEYHSKVLVFDAVSSIQITDLPAELIAAALGSVSIDVAVLHTWSRHPEIARSHSILFFQNSGRRSWLIQSLMADLRNQGCQCVGLFSMFDDGHDKEPIDSQDLFLTDIRSIRDCLESNESDFHKNQDTINLLETYLEGEVA